MKPVIVYGDFVPGSMHLLRRFERRGNVRTELPPLFLSSWPRPADWRQRAVEEARRHGYVRVMLADRAGTVLTVEPEQREAA